MQYTKRITVTEIGVELLCVRCRQRWPEDFFAIARPGKRHSYCRGCMTEFQAARRKRIAKQIRQEAKRLKAEAKQFVQAVKAGTIKITENYGRI